MSSTIHIAGRAIGAGHAPFIVAELSANHRGNLDRAMALLEAAHAAGVDAVKLQTYTADTMTIDLSGDVFRIESGLWSGRTLYQLYQEAATPWHWHAPLFRRGAELGLPVFSSPFDHTAVTFLESLNPPAYKIASFELTDLGLIAKAAATGRPLIMSTGLASDSEIDEALATARQAGCRDLIVLHCVSAYPAAPEDARLSAMAHLAARSGCPIGLSDHSLGSAVAVAATALGAVMIEKHFTLCRADGGPDAAFSMEPAEMAGLVREVRAAWAAVNGDRPERSKVEMDNLRYRRSLFVVADMRAGEPFTTENVRVIRPGQGLAPKHLAAVLGCQANRPIRRGEPLAWDMVSASASDAAQESLATEPAIS